MTTTDTDSLFARIGEPLLRAVIDDFVDRVFADVMIGYMFSGVDKPRLKQIEYQFIARGLGAAIVYQGRSIVGVHARLRIKGGQFSRRKTLLQQSLLDHGAPAEVIEAIMEHTERLRATVTGPAGSCVAKTAVAGPLVTSWWPGKVD